MTGALADPDTRRRPRLSIRRLSRFGHPILLLAWLCLCVAILSRFPAGPAVGVPGAVVYLLGGVLLSWRVFRCPACHALTTTTDGKPWGFYAAPFFTPRRCPRCALDFTAHTFWDDGAVVRGDTPDGAG